MQEALEALKTKLNEENYIADDGLAAKASARPGSITCRSAGWTQPTAGKIGRAHV